MAICVVGEGMLELSRCADDSWRLGHGGDTLNTAIHLARLGHPTAYFTALGADPFSARLRKDWAAEGLDTGLILTDPARAPGLYAILTDAAGERSFAYWRGESAARGLFALDGIDAALARAEAAQALVFSLITLAILPPAGRARLFDLCRSVRARGGRVAFDGNYRPRLWPSPDEARGVRDAAIGVADIGLPTLDDEIALAGAGDEHTVAAHWSALGCHEVVVKLGARGARLPDGAVIAPAAVLSPLDTSGAGDAFNAGYLAARLRGADPEPAARAGHQLAAWTILRPGAIPARDEQAPYDSPPSPSRGGTGRAAARVGKSPPPPKPSDYLYFPTLTPAASVPPHKGEGRQAPPVFIPTEFPLEVAPVAREQANTNLTNEMNNKEQSFPESPSRRRRGKWCFITRLSSDLFVSFVRFVLNLF